MIVVKIELHSARWPGHVRELGRMHIINDEHSDNPKRGNYHVGVLRKGSRRKYARTGRVEDYPRLSYNVWRLVARALKAAFPEEEK